MSDPIENQDTRMRIFDCDGVRVTFYLIAETGEVGYTVNSIVGSPGFIRRRTAEGNRIIKKLFPPIEAEQGVEIE